MLLLNKTTHFFVAKGVLLGLLSTLSFANDLSLEDLKLQDITSEVGVSSFKLSKSGVGEKSSINTTALYLEAKVKAVIEEYTPSFYLTLTKNSDLYQLSVRGGYEHTYAKESNYTPFTSLSGGFIYQNYTSDPISGSDTKDSSSTGLIAVAEAGAKLIDGYHLSTKLGVTNLKTEFEILGETGEVKEDLFISFGVGYTF